MIARFSIYFLIYLSVSVEKGFPQAFPLLPNDLCESAISIKPGERLSGLSNRTATQSKPSECPQSRPGTCIESFENDMWFRFETEAKYDEYEVQIITEECNTPAGLQALLIRSSSCDASGFIYQGCANPESTDTISLFLSNTQPGVSYFIYVDGFDGTICDYSLILKGLQASPRDLYQKMTYDYGLTDSISYFPAELRTVFENNTVILEWQGTETDYTDFYVIERALNHDSGLYYKKLALIPSERSVNTKEKTYQFIDYETDFVGQHNYYYRIIAVGKEGKKQVSDEFKVSASPITDFYLGEVNIDGQGLLSATYLNKKAKASYTLQLLTAEGELIKEVFLKKEPIVAEKIQIDMTTYASGTYILVLKRATQQFSRQFYWEGNERQRE